MSLDKLKKRLAAKGSKPLSQQLQDRTQQIAEDGAPSLATSLEEMRNLGQIDESVRRVPLPDIVVLKQARVDFVEIEELADSIYQSGQLQAGVIQKKPDGQLILRVGERRYRAIGLLNKRYPEDPKWQVYLAKVLEIDDDEARIIQLVENIQRDDLNPLEEALSVSQVMETMKLDQKSTAEALGKSTRWVSERIGLLKLPGDVQQAVKAGKVGMREALKNKSKPTAISPQGIQGDVTSGGNKQQNKTPGPRAPKERIRKITIPASLLVNTTKLLSQLAEQNGLEPITITAKSTQAEIQTAFELRALEILNAAVKK